MELQFTQSNQYRNDQRYRHFIINHLEYIESNRGPKDIRVITDVQAAPWTGDFYGLLASLDISQDLHWILLTINGLNSSLDFDGDGFTLKLIPLQTISRLDSMYKTTGM